MSISYQFMLVQVTKRIGFVGWYHHIQAGISKKKNYYWGWHHQNSKSL